MITQFASVRKYERARISNCTRFAIYCILKEGILTAYQSCSKIDTYQKNLKFDTKHNGKPVKSRLPVFFLHVVFSLDFMKEKFF